ncbi:MAG TPA: hypothetical protein VKU00_32540 [Chthonomonadaceae bacterium]|nr:hypothetical protein [Chthonomonadaceae bacterium]
MLSRHVIPSHRVRPCLRLILLILSALGAGVGLAACGSGGGGGGGGGHHGGGGGGGTPTPATRGSVISATQISTLTPGQATAQAQALGINTPATYGITFYKVDYNTVDTNGNLTTASGLVVVPNGAPGALPAVSYQHGAQFAKADVPSRNTTKETQYVALTFAPAGYIVVMADYLGMGDSPGPHPFLHADSEATACVDMLRAAKTVLKNLNFTFNKKLFLTGHAEGGHATLALHRAIEQQYNSEFAVTASAPIAGAYDLSGTQVPFLLNSQANTGDSVESSGVMAYLLIGYNPIYHLYTMPSNVFAPPYDTQAPALIDGSHTNQEVFKGLAIAPTTLLQSAFVTGLKTNPNFPPNLALQQNNVFDWKPAARVRLLHSKGDTLVTYQNAQVAYNRMTALGAQVELINLGDSIDHLAARNPGLANAKALFDIL